MKPALLVNENFPAPSTRVLRAAGLDVLAINELRVGMPDPEVMALARQQSRWLLTFDTDYAELVFKKRLAPPPAVLLMRERHYAPEDPAIWILQLLNSPEVIDGYFCVLTRSEMRKRPLLAAV